jgi:hypothetical protein
LCQQAEIRSRFLTVGRAGPCPEFGNGNWLNAAGCALNLLMFLRMVHKPALRKTGGPKKIKRTAVEDPPENALSPQTVVQTCHRACVCKQTTVRTQESLCCGLAARDAGNEKPLL